MAILFSFSFVLFVCVRLFLNLTQSMSFRLRDPAMIEFFSYPCLRLKVSSRGISYVSGKLPTYASPKAGFSLNFSSAGKGPFMDGKAKNIDKTFLGSGGGGGVG